MTGNKKHITYTTADIERYLEGKMLPGEMYAMELAANEDPFLAEALEGYMNSPTRDLSESISALEKTLRQKNASQTKLKTAHTAPRWLAAAAVILLFAGAAFTWYVLVPAGNEKVAQATEKTPGDTLIGSNEKIILKDSVAASAKTVAAQDTVQQPLSPQTNKPVKKAVNQPSGLTEEKKSAQTRSVANNTAPQPSPSRALKRREGQATSGLDKSRQANAVSQADDMIGAPNLLSKAYIFNGMVIDSNNNPLPFVNIRIATSKSNTHSDSKGNFRIVSGDSSLQLHLKALGFSEQVVELSSSDGYVKIKMTPQEQALRETVVTAYGNNKTKSILPDAEVEAEESYAEPADGWSSYDLYLENNVRSSPVNNRVTYQGTVDLSFTVNEYGAIYDFKVDLSSCANCEKEAVRLIKQGPRWKIIGPAKTTRVSLTLYF